MSVPSFNLPKFYRNFAWIFFSLALALLAFVVYLIWAKVTIIISPATSEVGQEFNFSVQAKDSVATLLAGDVVNGRVQEIAVATDQIFPATGLKPADAQTVGEVTIINNYSQDQTLVSSTRLAAPEDPETVLVRLKNTIVVPAGSQIKVQVYADNPDQFSAIKPMRFIIPGLWGPLQEKIYAQNDQTLGEAGDISIVAQSDLDNAQKTLKDKLYQQILEQANQYLTPQESLWPRLVMEQGSEINFSAQPGDEISEFSAAMTFKALLVVFDENQVLSLAREKIKSALASDQKLSSLNPGNFSYSVASYNAETQAVSVKVAIKANMVIAETNQLLDKSKLVGKTAEEIQVYFSQYPEVKSVEVKFFPNWLKKTPRIQEKIEIQIQAGN
ncbi:MAG: hypothetical protein A2744_00410 [Candidatus Buchananbacteria bacterium RIFCSPHIGHO2_01_FULL_44_11]|uniref:Baseplate protein J-like domain-containing protein n=1 Tax=Candidatus Buchananbacteria bacterium RIFCSPHIGHO2_01_FULL_44_11 TaxID=1797535 RepID=A0A1G1XZM6_9BACT|nr:MAG: hypothetical protein A2744_00410 [Candidatus Buchananbacteria bacterium RIFCSPHIGHO2_01_FULL_44_11]